jgi:hypothetical protein
VKNLRDPIWAFIWGFIGVVVAILTLIVAIIVGFNQQNPLSACSLAALSDFWGESI